MLKHNTLSGRHEAEVAQILKGQTTISSGNKYEKADVQVLDEGYWKFLVECKCTQKLGYRLTRSVWENVREQTYSRSDEMRPVMAIRFYDQDSQVNRASVEIDLAVLDLNDFSELLDERRRLQERIEELERERRR